MIVLLSYEGGQKENKGSQGMEISASPKFWDNITNSDTDHASYISEYDERQILELDWLYITGNGAFRF